MAILFSIIVFHLMAILAGRNLRETKSWGSTLLILLTLLLVGGVLCGIFTMENPEVSQ